MQGVRRYTEHTVSVRAVERKREPGSPISGGAGEGGEELLGGEVGHG